LKRPFDTSDCKQYVNRIKQAVLQRLREESKITQKQISLYLNVDQSMISKIENNERNPSVEMLDKLALYNARHNQWHECERWQYD
jgi:DNA-binding transcriptional regulator YiaG